MSSSDFVKVKRATGSSSRTRPEFIVKWLPDGTRTFVNEHYCRLFGLTEEECIGSSFFRSSHLSITARFTSASRR
jgi:PAS domain-containing protein